MAHTRYKAAIEFTAYLDDYENGEEFDPVNIWDETIVRDTKRDLKAAILEATYTAGWKDVDEEQVNDYDWCTECHTSYLADENNEGDASAQQIEQWKLGKQKLYAIHCHIIVTKITETKAAL